MRESEIIKTFLSFLNLNGVIAFRINSGQVYTKEGHIYRGAPIGTSDILGLIKEEGRFVAIEVKTPQTKNNVSLYQKDFINTIKKNGGIAFVAWDIESLKKGFKDSGYKFT